MSQELYLKGRYIDNNPTWHAEDSTWKAQQILRILQQNNLKPNSIGEIGCGAGEILNQLYAQMPSSSKFAGYEISPQAFELCQQRQKERLDFYLKNLLEEDAFFDLVLCIDIFEHIEDHFSFLRRLRQKSKHQVFHIPLDLSVSSVLRSSPILYARNIVGHLHYFSKETALATLKETGYEIVDYFYTAGSIDLTTRSLKTLLAKIPRKIMYQFNRDLAVRLLGGYSLMVLTK
jgi:2-polyprenyl-3-methyl-5-hydroxy-6-metoxy-1,4-benzoquinol methylase